MDRISRDVQIASRTFTVRELTVGEVRKWRDSLPSLAEDVIGGMLFDDITIGELCAMSDMDYATADALTPSELRMLAAAARELNPDFFFMRDRMVKAALAEISKP